MSRRAARNVLVTGRPGVGKTTLARKVADALGDRAGGFYTGEIREGGVRTGFLLTTLDGKTGILARAGARGPHRVGKYSVDVNDLESVGVPAIRDAISAGRVVIIDEIARMELFSEAFKQAVVDALDSECRVLATIQRRDDPFLNTVRSRTDVEIIEITAGNRDFVARRLISDFCAAEA